ncbi:MAG: hypothetical protein NZM65_07115 [Flavobacteriales bacterium]|nr:hypothetical protein [Flavobacteriales bacterium]MDW8410443.1 hypothetical protein [Flavobacteriales bacterium]
MAAVPEYAAKGCLRERRDRSSPTPASRQQEGRTTGSTPRMTLIIQRIILFTLMFKPM